MSIEQPINRQDMNIPSCSIDNHLFHFRALQGIIYLLLLAEATPFATAQISTESSSSPILAYSNFNPLVAITIAVLVCSSVFFTWFFCLYIRHCDDQSENSHRTAAAGLQQIKRGLDSDVIDSFPIFQYSQVNDLRIGKGGALECAVCLAEFVNDNTLRLLPKCDHVFHPECIDAWLTSHSTCPVCRANLTPNENELTEGNESTHSINSAGLAEAQNQIQISIDSEEIPNREVQASVMPKWNRGRGGKFSKSHSTGHSPIQSGENSERYTLRLPGEMRRQMTSQSLKRTISCGVVFPWEGSSRKGDRNNRMMHVGLSDRDMLPDR